MVVHSSCRTQHSACLLGRCQNKCAQKMPADHAAMQVSSATIDLTTAEAKGGGGREFIVHASSLPRNECTMGLMADMTPQAHAKDVPAPRRSVTTGSCNAHLGLFNHNALVSKHEGGVGTAAACWQLVVSQLRLARQQRLGRIWTVDNLCTQRSRWHAPASVSQQNPTPASDMHIAALSWRCQAISRVQVDNTAQEVMHTPVQSHVLLQHLSVRAFFERGKQHDFATSNELHAQLVCVRVFLCASTHSNCDNLVRGRTHVSCVLASR